MSKTLDVVDRDNQIIGKDTRERIHGSELWHRGVHILLLNSKGHLVLQVRSAEKDKFPGHYDCSASEHVEGGETYEAAAIRGMREELGIVGVRLKMLIRFRMNYGPNDNMISQLYECLHDGPTRTDRHEAACLKALSLEKIREMLARDEGRFAPWTKEILRWYLGMPSNVDVLSVAQER